MKRIELFLISALCLFAAACGGSGGSPSAKGTVVGRVLNVATGGPTNPTSTVQIGTKSTQTSLSDGSFTLANVSQGGTSLTVDNGVPPLWNFTIPAIEETTDVGDLWVGPERVTLTGTVRDAATSNPISGAMIAFGGRFGTTNASGVFALQNVAYATSTQTAFWGIVGSATATGYFRNEWTAAPNTAVAGTVTVNDILLSPTSDPTPPGEPFNLWGVISAPGGASGSIVRLKQSGVDVRVYNVGSDGRYRFFVLPGSYVISASKGASTAPDVPVTLTAPNQQIRNDISIP